MPKELEHRIIFYEGYSEEEDKGMYDGFVIKSQEEPSRYGYGKMIYSNGNVYEGMWENDMRHGHGVLKNSDDEILYDGEWTYGHEK